MLLNDRAFWLPTTDQSRRSTKLPSFLPTCSMRGGIMIIIGLVFLWFAQMTFSRLEGRFAEKL